MSPSPRSPGERVLLLHVGLLLPLAVVWSVDGMLLASLVLANAIEVAQYVNLHNYFESVVIVINVFETAMGYGLWEPVVELRLSLAARM